MSSKVHNFTFEETSVKLNEPTSEEDASEKEEGLADKVINYKMTVNRQRKLFYFALFVGLVSGLATYLFCFFTEQSEVQSTRQSFYDVCNQLHNGTHCDQFWDVLLTLSSRETDHTELWVSIVCIFIVVVCLLLHDFGGWVARILTLADLGDYLLTRTKLEEKEESILSLDSLESTQMSYSESSA